MRKMKERLLAVLASLSIIVIFMAGACGGDNGTSTPTTPEPTPTPTTEPTPTSVAPTPFPVDTFTSRAYGLTISIPQGWIVDDSDPRVLTIANPAGLASIEITLSTFDEPLSETQFSAFVDTTILILQGDFDDFEQISREEVVASTDVLLQFTFTEDGKERMGTALFTFDDARAVVLLALVDDEFFDFFEQLFEEITDSLELQSTSTGPTPTPDLPTVPPSTPVATVTPGTFTDPSSGFTLDIPSGWSMMAPGKGTSIRLTSTEGVTVQVLNAAIPSAMTVEVYALALKEARYGPLPGYGLLSETDTTVGSLNAREVQFTAATGQGRSVEKYLVLVAKRGTQAYILEAIGDPSVLDQQEAEIRGLMGSFRP